MTPKVIQLKVAVHVRMTVKKSVDSPMIAASVPNIENLSFHRFMHSTSRMFNQERRLYLFCSRDTVNSVVMTSAKNACNNWNKHVFK